MKPILLELLELKPGQRVLDIGLGSGYNAALRAQIVAIFRMEQRAGQLQMQNPFATKSLLAGAG